jgi:hypothetical protein
MSINKPIDAGAPFDSLHADVILRSSDNIDFRTFKLLLSLASPVFEGMFDMPQPALGNPINKMKDGAPVVQMAENSRTLEAVLQFCHPNCTATPISLDITSDVLAAAEKYEMGAVLEWARANLLQLGSMDEQSVQAFAIACKHKLEDEERILAKQTLRISESDLPEPGRISGRLYKYRQDCQIEAQKLTTRFQWIELDRNMVRNGCDSCIAAADGRIDFKFGDTWRPREWWIEYMRMAGRELEKRPVADTVLQPELLEWVGYRVNECCCRRALADIQIFNRTIFSKAIEYVTSKVSYRDHLRVYLLS